MNSANLSIDFRPPFGKFPLAAMLMTALLLLALLSLTNCSTQKQTIQSKNLSHHRQTLSHSDSASLTANTFVFDTIHIVSNETIWREPDSIGRQYPLKTIRRESAATHHSLSDMVIQKKDTIYINTTNTNLTNSDNQIRAPTNTWLPWLIIAGMVIVAIIILAIRIFLLKL